MDSVWWAQNAGRYQPHIVIHEMRRRAKSGIFTASKSNPNAIAAANSQATTEMVKGAMAIPQIANVEMMNTSVTEDSTRIRLGRSLHKRCRPRIT
jgi:hypothetical protein